MSDRPRYELSEADVDAAWDCARSMVDYNAGRGWRDRAYKLGDSRLSNFALGNYGEIAVSRWAGVPWTCQTGAYAKYDVVAGELRLNVRTTRYIRRPLLALYGARTDSGLFVLAALDAPFVELVGWIDADVGRSVGELLDFGSGVPASYVGADSLNPMGTLRR